MHLPTAPNGPDDTETAIHALFMVRPPAERHLLSQGGDTKSTALGRGLPRPLAPGSGVVPADVLGHAGGLFLALDLDRDLVHDLDPAFDVRHREVLRPRPDPRASTDRRRE